MHLACVTHTSDPCVDSTYTASSNQERNLRLRRRAVPLSAGQWGVCVAMASGVLWFSEGRKLLRRLWTRQVHARADDS
jgi:hypothetical protein